jgi:hypothetical protein
MSNSKRRMLDRVEGLFVIGNTVLPFALFVLVVWGVASTWAALGPSLASYQASLTRIIEGAQRAKADLQQVASDVLETTRGVREEGEKASESIDRVVKTFDKTLDGFSAAFVDPFKGPFVPDFIKSGMRDLGKSVAAPFRPLSREFNKVGASIRTIKSEVASMAAKVAELKKLEDYFDTVIAEYQQIRRSVDETVATVGRTLRILAYFMLALALWSATGYLLWVRGRLRRGLALIRGQTESQ